MKLSLEPLTEYGAELARQWRNAALETLRTPFPLTMEQQDSFYHSLQDRNSPHRYWQVVSDYAVSPVGMAGLTNIDYTNGHAEISLIISPNERGKGIGKEAVRLVLDQAFSYMGLRMVYGEVYDCNHGIAFWEKVISPYTAYSTRLLDRKYWNRRWYDSLYFSINSINYFNYCDSAWRSDRTDKPTGPDT